MFLVRTDYAYFEIGVRFVTARPDASTDDAACWSQQVAACHSGLVP